MYKIQTQSHFVGFQRILVLTVEIGNSAVIS